MLQLCKTLHTVCECVNFPMCVNNITHLPASLETETATPRSESLTLLQTVSMSRTECMQSGPSSMQDWEAGQKLQLSRRL